MRKRLVMGFLKSIDIWDEDGCDRGEENWIGLDWI